ncbi:MAG: restriction endonuclease subunit S [Flavobacteriales bacterium]|nr:restriction endonuclease subunit S [Flavobacteriales bacterium]
MREDWAEVELGKIVLQRKEKLMPTSVSEMKFIGMDCLESYSINPHQLHNFKDFRSSGNVFYEGDVLYGRLRPYLNKVTKAKFHGAASGEFIILEPKAFLDGQYLLYCIHGRGFVEYAMSQISGDRPRIKYDQIAEFPFFLPPLPEQRAIVSKIEQLFSELDNGIANLKTAQQQLKVYRHCVLSSAVEGEPDTPISKVLNSLSQGWSPKCINRNSEDPEEWAVIKTSAIQHGDFLQFENKILPTELEPRKQHEIEEGDILITRAGPRVRVGVCCLVRKTRKRLINCDKVYLLKLNRDLILPEYFEALMNAPEYLKQIEKIKSGSSDSGLNLTQDRFKQIELTLPSLPRQHQIIQEIESRLSVCDKLEESIAQSLQKAEALRQSILKKAFEGRLLTAQELATCKKEKDWESAGVLLERVKAEKTKKK